MVDEAEISARYGNQVYFLLCNSHFGLCGCNLYGDTFKCYRCTRYVKRLLNKCSPGIKVIEPDQEMMDLISKEVEKCKFEYHSIEEIKSLDYKGAKVGLACLSAYMTTCRNNNPLIDDEFRAYFDRLLRVACNYAEFQCRMIDEIKPDRIQIFNGRFMENRPATDFALQRHILLRSCEHWCVFPHCSQKRHYYNALPHNIANNAKMINQLWNDDTIPLEEKERIGRNFYERKYNHTYYGDKDYSSSQVAEKMPDNWDASKKNYVIFNSSEDEFTCIGDEYDKAKVFPSQYEGILYIANLLKDRQDIRLYLRIHPNLKNIKYKYHTDLLGLGERYDNLFVIRGDSDVSTYALMRAADKVITFGSTTGVEASYMRKPVIALCRSWYSGIDVCYEPTSVEEMMELLMDENLKAKPEVETLKYGYFLVSPHLPGYSFFDYNWRDFKFLGKSVRQYNLAKYFGSRKLYAITGMIIGHFCRRYKLPLKEKE